MVIMQTLFFLLLIWLFLSCLILAKTSLILGQTELRRRAVKTQSKLDRAYTMFSYQVELKLVVWLVGSLAFAGVLSKLFEYSWLSVVAFILVTGWVIFAWHPKKAGGWYYTYCILLALPLVRILSGLRPVAARMDGLLAKLWPLDHRLGIYEVEDLLELIKNQKNQPENRIPETDLRIAYGALAFCGKKISEVMTPRRRVKTVGVDESIGPHLLDELHASGFSRFPVVSGSSKSTSAEIVGTLYAKDLAMRSSGGKVSDVMNKDVFFINEAGTLRQALDGFIKTRHHLLVVVNSFEEVVGVISFEDVIEQIFGVRILDEFDQYGDLRKVAAAEAKKDHKEHKEVKISEQTDKTVVE